jgi:hypothetical protein
MTDKPADIVIPGEGVELLGKVFEANAKWSEDMANRVEDNYRRDVDEWKAAYLRLYDAVEAANKFVDSKRIDNVLFRFGQKANFAAQPSWWAEKR